MKETDSRILNNYWGLIKTLHTSSKLDLIERLTQSIRENLEDNPNTMKKSFGAWKSDKTAEQLIEEIRESRNTNRQIESM